MWLRARAGAHTGGMDLEERHVVCKVWVEPWPSRTLIMPSACDRKTTEHSKLHSMVDIQSASMPLPPPAVQVYNPVCALHLPSLQPGLLQPRMLQTAWKHLHRGFLQVCPAWCSFAAFVTFFSLPHFTPTAHTQPIALDPGSAPRMTAS